MVYLISLLIIFCFPKNWKSKYYLFLLYLPIIDTLHNILPGKHIGNHFLAPIVLIFVCLQIILKGNKPILKKYYSVKYLVIFLCLLLLSFIFTTDFWTSLRFGLGFASALLCLPAFIILFNTIDEKYFTQFAKNIVASATIYIVYILVSTIFSFGNDTSYATYGMDTVHFGGISFFSFHAFALFLIFVLWYSLKNKGFIKIYYLLLYIGGAIIFIAIAKRSYLIPLGLSALLFFNPLNKGNKLFAFFGILAVILLLNSDYFEKYFYEVRKARVETNIEDEGRALELINYRYEIINHYPIYNVLFGHEIFNSQGKFFHGADILKDYDPQGRILHSDYSNLLYGTGIVGTLVYILFMFSTLFDFLRYSGKKSKYWLLFISIFILIVVVGFSDGILYYSNRIFHYAFLGSILGLALKNNYKNQNTSNSKIRNNRSINYKGKR